MIQAGWAYYRLGLAYQTSGDQEKAIKAFEKALEDYPKHPAAALCWLELGSAYLKAGSHGHAVRALRAALELPLDQAQQIKASWLLGVALHGMAEYVPAIEAFERCLKEDPDWHLKQPLLLKNLGESYFFQKEYDKSRDLLLWYLNLQPEAPDRDLVLAKIAEIFTAQDQPEYAAKLFAHIQSNYPDSEGDVIAQIRKMESLKTKGRLSLEDDLTFFRELAQKPLSPQLTRLIHLKLASREHEYGNSDTSLSVIDYNLQGISSAVANPEFLALRAKVVTDWLKSAFKNRDYGTVVLLYENNQSTFANANNADLNLMIADSYVGIKQPQKAIALYEQVLAKQGPAAQNELFARMAEAAFHGQGLRTRRESLLTNPGLAVSAQKEAPDGPTPFLTTRLWQSCRMPEQSSRNRHPGHRQSQSVQHLRRESGPVGGVRESNALVAQELRANGEDQHPLG